MIRIFILFRDSWSTGPAMAERRETLGITVHKNRNAIFAVGGFDGNIGLKSVEMLDPRIGNFIVSSSLSD